MPKKLFILYIIIVLLLITLPINGKESRINHIYVLSFRLDHIFHVLLFCPWMFFLKYIKLIFFNKELSAVKWLMIGLFFCVFTECMQYFIPYRAFNINDLIANSIGITLSLLLYLILLPKKTIVEKSGY